VKKNRAEQGNHPRKQNKAMKEDNDPKDKNDNTRKKKDLVSETCWTN
jgi:hypothetical protein